MARDQGLRVKTLLRYMLQLILVLAVYVLSYPIAIIAMSPGDSPIPDWLLEAYSPLLLLDTSSPCGRLFYEYSSLYGVDVWLPPSAIANSQ